MQILFVHFSTFWCRTFILYFDDYC